MKCFCSWREVEKWHFSGFKTAAALPWLLITIPVLINNPGNEKQLALITLISLLEFKLGQLGGMVIWRWISTC